MKLSRILSAAYMAVFLCSSTAFAAPDLSSSPDVHAVQQSVNPAKEDTEDFKGEGFKRKQTGAEKHKDPIKALQGKKEKVQQLLKEGKITKEKADVINKKIDSRIKEIQEFNKLTLQQKKDKLIGDFNAAIEKKVSEGKLDRSKADELIKNYTEKVQKWDGSGYPAFWKHGCRGKKLPGSGQ